MKIEWDETNNVIRVGKADFSQYTRWRNSAEWANKVLVGNDMVNCRLNTYAVNRIEDNKRASEALGCSRSVLYNHFNKLQLKAFIVPIYDIVKKIGYSRKGFNVAIVNKTNKNKDKLQEAYNDKLYNILPIVAATGMSPKELKQEFKGAWKTISKNSLNKNKALSYAASKTNRFVALAHIPTTVLENFAGHDNQTIQYIANNFKGSWNKTLVQETRLFIDTQLMAERLGEVADPKWSVRRVKEEHDRMSKELTARKYSKDVFDSVKDIPVKFLKSGEYTATMLDSAFLIADEGNAMGHCVASYSDSVREEHYLVYSVTKNGERSSTIGINIKHGWKGKDNKEPYFILQQQYGRYNTYVTDEEEKNFAQTLVGLLNKKIDSDDKSV